MSNLIRNRRAHAIERFGRLARLASAIIFYSFVFSLSPLLHAVELPEAAFFQKVPLVTGLANAVDFEIAPDGRIFILNRYGGISLYKPNSQSTVSVGRLDVYIGIEAGLIGIAIDPNFTSNQFIYLFYSPSNSKVNRLSRFKMQGDTLNLSSEVILLNVPVDRAGGNHDGGNLEFDKFGNLLIGTGDDTMHGSYAALHETNWIRSAEKSSANTKDLRGKILRIHPEPNGTYTIPSGNLFTSAAQGLPEIYVMGARNPYKFSVDPATNILFWGDIGPDANEDGALGPSGKDEINRTLAAGNYGWPHFIGPNQPYFNTYLKYYFNPLQPTNDSQWNTGPRILPAAKGAWITLQRQSYMAGPVYHFNPSVTNPSKLPESMDGHFFYWDFNTSKVWYVGFNSDGTIYRHELWQSISELGLGYIDFEIGPDHSLYVLEYGTGCCEFDVGNGVLSRMDYVGDVLNLSPVAVATADHKYGSLPLSVNFSSSGTYDPDGDPLQLEWDFETDGTVDATTAKANHVYSQAGTYNAQLKVIDTKGASSAANLTIYAGNNIANVNYAWPPQGGLYTWDEFIDVNVTVSDVEDGSIQNGGIPCSAVNIIPALGHLEHSHDAPSFNTCKTAVQIVTDHDPNGEDDLFYQLQASYQDQSGLASYKVIQVYPKRVPAEFPFKSNSIQRVPNTDTDYSARNTIRAIGDQSYIALASRNLSHITAVKYRIASIQVGGSIELRLDSPTGTLIKSTPIPSTGGYDIWTDVEDAFAPPSGSHDLYFVFRKGTGSSNTLFDLASVEFVGDGISYRTSPALATLEVSPAVSNVILGTTHQFTATGFDQYHDPVSTDVTWQVTGGGSINSGGLFSATTLGGPFIVTATSANDNKIKGTASLHVVEQPPQTGTNLAANKPANASSQENTSFPPSKAFDGNASTRWASLEGKDPQWLSVDLGALQVINRVLLNWELAFGKAYEIQVSPDGKAWTPVYSETNGNGGIDDITFPSVNTRYVRLFGTQRGTVWGYSLYEMQVFASATTLPPILTSAQISPTTANLLVGESQAFTATGLDQYGNPSPGKFNWSVNGGGTINASGLFTATQVGGPFLVTAQAISNSAIKATSSITVGAGTPTPTGNLALNKPTTASSVESADYLPGKALDGNALTRWSSKASNKPQWLSVDLGKIYSIDRVVLHWEAAFGKAYQIQVSQDGSNWSNVFFEINGTGGVDDHSFPSVNARFVRVYGTERGTVWGYSLWEFEIYGLSAPPAPATLNSITVSPAAVDVLLNTQQKFTAEGRDQYGSVFNTSFNWTVTGGGSIDAQGTFTASTLGTAFVVSATSPANGNISGKASVNVVSQPSPTVNLSKGKPATSSSQESKQSRASFAVDGVQTTRWASIQGIDPSWIAVDLGAPYSLERVVLNWEAAYAKRYQLQVSSDGNNWSTVFTEAGGNGGSDTISLGGVIARHVRVFGTQRGTGWGYSLWELEVFGK